MPDATHDVPEHSSYAASCYPWLTVAGLDGVTSVIVPPGGHIAEVYAQMDSLPGVWVAPAGMPLTGVMGLSQQITRVESDLLSSRGINVLRAFPGQGNRVWGAHTTSQAAEWKYVNVRRLAIFIERSLSQGLQWAVFEPNGPTLWAAVRLSIEEFLLNLWKSGGSRGPSRTGRSLSGVTTRRCRKPTLPQGGSWRRWDSRPFGRWNSSCCELRCRRLPRDPRHRHTLAECPG